MRLIQQDQVVNLNQNLRLQLVRINKERNQRNLLFHRQNNLLQIKNKFLLKKRNNLHHSNLQRNRLRLKRHLMLLFNQRNLKRNQLRLNQQRLNRLRLSQLRLRRNLMHPFNQRNLKRNQLKLNRLKLS